MKAKYSTKKHVREAILQMNVAEKELDKVRDHYDFEWGDNGNCDLDLAISFSLQKLLQAKQELVELLMKFKDKGIPLNWKHGRSWV